jgi:hypothetical protein
MLEKVKNLLLEILPERGIIDIINTYLGIYIEFEINQTNYLIVGKCNNNDNGKYNIKIYKRNNRYHGKISHIYDCNEFYKLTDIYRKADLLAKDNVYLHHSRIFKNIRVRIYDIINKINRLKEGKIKTYEVYTLFELFAIQSYCNNINILNKIYISDGGYRPTIDKNYYKEPLTHFSYFPSIYDNIYQGEFIKPGNNQKYCITVFKGFVKQMPGNNHEKFKIYL